MCMIIFEKSPPNLMRIRDLASIFPKNYVFATNRDPYAWVGSSIRRAHKNSELKRQAANYFSLAEKQAYRNNATRGAARSALIRAFTRQWIDIASEIEIVTTELALNVVTYEALTANLASVINIMPPDIKMHLSDVNLEPEIQVKDHPAGAFRNKNAESLASLTSSDLSEISDELSDNEDLLRYFGYQLLAPR